MAKKKISNKVAKKAAKKAAKAAKKVTKKAVRKAVRKSITSKKAAPKKKTAASGKAAPKKVPKARKELVSLPDPSPETVAERAYQIYLERMEKGLPGDERSDWLAAEESLRVA